MFTAGTVLAFAVPRRLYWPLLVLVYVTVGVQSLFTKLVGEVGGTFVAAAVLSAAATLLARAEHRPPRLVLPLPGFFTLTVGSLGMRGLTTLDGVRGGADGEEKGDVSRRRNKGVGTRPASTQAIQKKTAVIRFSSSVLPW
ncbi:hypothetical protein OG588_25905 [Streptomyces prunicolor]|uniref:hypothetical protein n=1 Tax=Streptomyces prunicolor TaxID=67348 RepID=UPI0038688A57|nr:hypothetical protein OG588_25905 [Streptomyces prunicolor]